MFVRENEIRISLFSFFIPSDNNKKFHKNGLIRFQFYAFMTKKYVFGFSILETFSTKSIHGSYFV